MDPILEMYFEQKAAPSEIIAAGHDAEQVVHALITHSRYPVPQPLLVDVAETMDRYGRLTLLKEPVDGHDDPQTGLPVTRLVLRTTDRAVLAEIMRHKKITPLLGDRVDDDVLVVASTDGLLHAAELDARRLRRAADGLRG